MPEEQQLSNYCKEKRTGEPAAGEREGGIAINCQCLVTLASRALQHALWLLSLKSRVPLLASRYYSSRLTANANYTASRTNKEDNVFRGPDFFFLRGKEHERVDKSRKIFKWKSGDRADYDDDDADAA